MTERIRIAGRRRRLRHGRGVFAAPPVPVWVPEPHERDAVGPARVLRGLVRGRGPGTLQPVEEAALRTVSDASAVLSVVRR